MIREITTEAELRESVAIMAECFAPLIAQMKLTPETYPWLADVFKYETFKSVSDFLGERLFALTEEDRKIGFVSVGKTRDGVCSFGKLALLPRHVKETHAKELLDIAEQTARGEGAVKMRVGFIDENVTLKEFYLAHGFQVTDIKTFEVLPFSICVMEKDLE